MLRHCRDKAETSRCDVRYEMILRVTSTGRLSRLPILDGLNARLFERLPHNFECQRHTSIGELLGIYPHGRGGCLEFI
jgi:hypothetical protein